MSASAPNPLLAGRIPSLDGLRGVAILSVIVGHYFGHQNQLSIPTTWKQLHLLAEWGVDLFFAISGFIITLLLIRESQRTGTISLPMFYARRALRILPAYIFFLLMLFILDRFSPFVQEYDWLKNITMTGNILGINTPTLSHLWSLAIEEHFYLIWPLVFFLLGAKRASYVALAFMFIQPALRPLVEHYLPSVPLYHSTMTRFDGLLAGCLLAIWGTGAAGLVLPRCGQKAATVLIASLAFLFTARVATLNNLFGELPWMKYIYHSCTAWAMMGVVWAGITTSPGILFRVLNHPWLMAIGVVSYSLYLWQHVFTVYVEGWWWSEFPYGLLLLPIFVIFSYYVIERPFLLWRDSLKERKHDKVVVS